MHIISSTDFTPEMLDDIFLRADVFQRLVGDDDADREMADRYKGKIFYNIFYEPSTRTRTSFATAAVRLGLEVIETENAEKFSSASKGETLEDSIRVYNQYKPSIITIRHHETGALARAAAVSDVPIFNAGDGKGEHPTQALLDAYTIDREKGRLDDLNVVFGGDLKRGRTARSLTRLLTQYPDNRFTFISPKGLRMEDDIKNELDEKSVQWAETTDMKDAFKDADVIYWTRTQKERSGKLGKFSVGNLWPKTSKNSFIIERQHLTVMQEDAIIMHPLPRVDEIAKEVDPDHRAIYFRQAGNGMYIRMALIDMVMSAKQEV